MNLRAVSALFLSALLSLAFVTSCSSGGYDEPERRGGGRGGDAGWSPRAGGTAGGLELALPADWWHDSYVAAPLNLSPDQMAALDTIGRNEEGEIAKLLNDTEVALRELRDQLDGEKPSGESIMTAGHRLRDLRDARFDRELQLVADERQVLTREQWSQLQQQLQQQRRPQNRNGGQGRGGRGGRGGFGGRGGRGSGWPG